MLLSLHCSPLSCAHDSVSVSNVALLPLRSAWTPLGSVGDMLSWGQNQPEHLASFIQSCTGWPALLEHHYSASSTCVLCFVLHFDAVWCCFAIWLKGSCKSVCGLGVVPCLVWFGSFCNVSFPLSPFSWLLEAAQRHGIFHGECRVQELPVFTDNWLHWRGESPPAQRTGPLTGHCTRRSMSQKLKSKSYFGPFISIFWLSVFVLRLCPRKKKCWSGRGSMRTAGRRWWRWGKWDLGWHYITARIQSKDLTPPCFFEWEVVTKGHGQTLPTISLS